jgi:hypothetical protein
MELFRGFYFFGRSEQPDRLRFRFRCRSCRFGRSRNGDQNFFFNWFHRGFGYSDRAGELRESSRFWHRLHLRRRWF